MDFNESVHLTIQMDLDLNHMVENGFSLEKLFDWTNLQSGVVVGDIMLHVDAPETCMVDECFHLPCGYYGARRRQYPIISLSGPDRSGATIAIMQIGNPFSLLKTDDDVISMVDSIMGHTASVPLNRSLEYRTKDSTNAEAMLLQACCFYLRSQCNKTDHSLYSVLKLLHTAFSDDGTVLQEGCTMDILFEDLRVAEPQSRSVSAYDAVFEADSDIVQCALYSCIHRLESLSEKGLRSIIADMQGA